MRIVFTRGVIQASPDFFENEKLIANVPADKFGIVPLPDHLHEARKDRRKPLEPLYAGSRWDFADKDGNLFYYAPAHSVLNVELGDWVEMRSLMCQFFMGCNKDYFKLNPDEFNGLPFYTFLQHGVADTFFPPTGIEAMVADFANVRTDGADQDFFAMAKQSGEKDAVVLYQKFLNRLVVANSMEGSYACYLE